MPCSKCRADFNILTWKLKCIECELPYCSKCLRKQLGCTFCEKCAILNKRPPDRDKLMELRSKDLQQYLNKNHISTHGLVEKGELVELFYRRSIPVRQKRGQKFSSVLGGSVPNLAAQSQEHFNNLRANMRSYVESGYNNYISRNVGPSGSQSTTSSPIVQNNRPQFQPQRTPETPLPTTSWENLQTQPQANEPNLAPSRPKYPKLTDFEKVEDLNDLSVKQLKELLTLNRVDYKGCVEKAELLDRAVRLWNDTYKPKESEGEPTLDNLCKICMDAPLSCVILECGHMATCVDCGKQLAECPICRQYVTRVVRTFKA